MKTNPYLIFSLHDLPYAIAAKRVKEIFLLPELTPITDAPPDIIGLLNLHSQIVPVMHLDLRLGQPFTGCNFSDSVIVVESQGLEVGVVVHQVQTVEEIDSQYIQQNLSYGRDDLQMKKAFVTGTIILDDETIPILDVDLLIRHSEKVEALVDREVNTVDQQLTAQKLGNFYDLYFPQVGSSEKATFRQRAQNLRVSEQDSAINELHPVAIFRLGDEYFGFDLEIVREFINIDRVTTIPCCPKRIIGNMNLRGEILTLVDIRQILHLDNQDYDLPKAVVINFDDIVAGIAVDEVLDVIYYHREQMKPVPVGINKSVAEYLHSTTSYLNKLLNIIDLPKILDHGVLTVDLAV
ncbi:MAG: chemotaxis protein CheW [Pleurocapsa sp.]